MYLGVRIDNKLTFTGHISNILRRVYYIVSTLTYLVPFFELDVRHKVFVTSILPHIIYAVPVWYHFLLACDKQRIRAFLKYCAKIFRLDYESMVDQVNGGARREFIRLSRNIQREENHPLHAELKSMCRHTSYNLRNRALTPKYRVQVFRNSFVYRASIFIQHDTLNDLI